jgi:hypothetical protein
MAGAWKMFRRAKHFIGNGTMSLSATSPGFRIGLALSSSNLKTTASARPLVYKGSLTNPVASTTGSPLAGDALAGETWTGSWTQKFAVTNHVFTAVGSSIVNIKYAYIFMSGASDGASKLLCYSTLTTTPFSLAVSNTLTIQINANGVLTLV